MTTTLSPTDLLALLAAIPVAALGGASFLAGVLGVAVWLRVPKLLVATTIAAFATSSPELAVSSLAAASGKPGIGLGDALGSNLVNLGLIMGMALLLRALPARLHEVRSVFALALLVPALTLALALDGQLTRTDGLLLLVLFAFWLVLIVRQASDHRRATPASTEAAQRPLYAGLLLLVGMAGLVGAGQLFVAGATGIATTLGVPPYVIGATLVAIGTSMPEIVTVLLSRLRGHDEVGLGTLLGSNVFNGLAVVGTAATIHPISAPVAEVAPALVLGTLVVLLMLPRDGLIPRWRGPALLATYAGFIVLTAAPPF